MILEERFNHWNKLKQKIHSSENPNVFVNQREVWYISN